MNFCTRRPRRTSYHIHLLLLIFSLLSITITCQTSTTTTTHDSHEDDLLAEILAEEKLHEEEHARMAAEQQQAQEYLRQQQQQQQQQQQPPSQKEGSKKKTMPKRASMDFSSIEEEIRRKEADVAARRAAEEERLAEQKAEKRRLAREAKFEAELAKMDADKAKAARRQKKKDAKIVRRILNAANKERYYDVLGLHNWFVDIGPWKFFHITTKDVKKAYRNLAKLVHPDKNRDGRAVEAFDALERAAATLSDDKLKNEYDRKVMLRRRSQRREIMRMVSESFDVTRKACLSVVGIFSKVVGPFSTPLLIMGALII